MRLHLSPCCSNRAFTAFHLCLWLSGRKKNVKISMNVKWCKMLHHVCLQLCAGVTSQEDGKSLKDKNWMGSFAEEYLEQAGAAPTRSHWSLLLCYSLAFNGDRESSEPQKREKSGVLSAACLWWCPVVLEEWALTGSTSVPLSEERGVLGPLLGSWAQERQGATGEGQWRPQRWSGVWKVSLIRRDCGIWACLEKRRLRGDLSSVYEYPKCGCQEDGARIFW